MSLLDVVKGLFARRSTYVLVWREHNQDGALMRGEPIHGKSDADARSLAIDRFKRESWHWAFWVLFRPDDTHLAVEPGPMVAKWAGDISEAATDAHVQSALQAVRRDGKPVSRTLRKVKLLPRGRATESEA